MDRGAGLRRFVLTSFLGAMVVGVAACAPPSSDAPSPPTPADAESNGLRLRLVDLPPVFTVVENTGSVLTLEPADADIAGRIEFLVSPPADGQNLVSAVKFHQAFVENQEGGDYQGGQELVGPLGTAFYSRGRFILDGESVEETVVFTLHPDADRILRLRYRYPTGVDSSIRVQQLFDVLACVEGFDPQAPQPGGSTAID